MNNRIVSILHEPTFNLLSAVGTEPEPLDPRIMIRGGDWVIPGHTMKIHDGGP